MFPPLWCVLAAEKKKIKQKASPFFCFCKVAEHRILVLVFIDMLLDSKKL